MVFLNKSLWATALWYFSLGRRLARITPGFTITIIFSTLLSQVFLLAAFFLPLKAVLLITSPNIPHYFPRALQNFHRDELVIGLSVFAVALYIAHLLLERLISLSTTQGSKKLLDSTNGVVLFEHQEELAGKAYQRFSRSLAGTAFIFLALVGLTFLYPKSSIVFVAYWIFIFSIFICAQVLSSSFRTKYANSPGTLPNILSSVGFLAIFIFIISDHLYGIAPGAITTIITLLIARQSMQQAAALIKDITVLRSQQMQINALFIHGHILQSESKDKDLSFWSLIECPGKVQWITTVLQEVSGITIGSIEVRWHQTGIHDVAAFEVTTNLNDLASSTRYLVKLFNSNRRTLALHEASILAECKSLQFPSLEFLGGDFVNKFHCHVFRWSNEQKFSLLDVKNNASEFSTRIMSFVPPRALIERQCNSSLFIWNRITPSALDRLLLVCRDDSERKLIDRLSKSLPRIFEILKNLPLQVANPDINRDNLLHDGFGRMFVSYWGRWSLEPLGSCLFITAREIQKFPAVLEALRSARSDIGSVTLEQITLAAFMSAFEKLIQRQLYISALELLPQIISCFARIEQTRVQLEV